MASNFAAPYPIRPSFDDYGTDLSKSRQELPGPVFVARWNERPRGPSMGLLAALLLHRHLRLLLCLEIGAGRAVTEPCCWRPPPAAACASAPSSSLEASTLGKRPSKTFSSPSLRSAPLREPGPGDARLAPPVGSSGSASPEGLTVAHGGSRERRLLSVSARCALLILLDKG